MRHFERWIDGSGARRPGDVVLSKLLAANVAETITVPSGATSVLFSSTADFYAWYNASTDVMDLVSNGTFASDTVWTKGTGWTIAAGVATSDASQAGNSDLEQTPAGTSALVEGKAYLVTYTLTRSAGTIAPLLGGTAGTTRSSAATFSETIIAGSGGKITFRADLDFAGTVDTVSVVPVAVVPGDNATGYAAELVKADVPEESRTRIISGVSTISVVSPGTPILTASFFQD